MGIFGDMPWVLLGTSVSRYFRGRFPGGGKPGKPGNRMILIWVFRGLKGAWQLGFPRFPGFPGFPVSLFTGGTREAGNPNYLGGKPSISRMVSTTR